MATYHQPSPGFSNGAQTAKMATPANRDQEIARCLPIRRLIHNHGGTAAMKHIGETRNVGPSTSGCLR